MKKSIFQYNMVKNICNINVQVLEVIMHKLGTLNFIYMDNVKLKYFQIEDEFLTRLIYRTSILHHTCIINLMYQFMHKNFKYKYFKY